MSAGTKPVMMQRVFIGHRFGAKFPRDKFQTMFSELGLCAGLWRKEIGPRILLNTGRFSSKHPPSRVHGIVLIECKSYDYEPQRHRSTPGLNAPGPANVEAQNVEVRDSVKYIPDIQRVTQVDLRHLQGFA